MNLTPAISFNCILETTSSISLYLWIIPLNNPFLNMISPFSNLNNFSASGSSSSSSSCCGFVSVIFD